MNITSMETTGIKAGASFMNGLTFFGLSTSIIRGPDRSIPSRGLILK